MLVRAPIEVHHLHGEQPPIGFDNLRIGQEPPAAVKDRRRRHHDELEVGPRRRRTRFGEHREGQITFEVALVGVSFETDRAYPFQERILHELAHSTFGDEADGASSGRSAHRRAPGSQRDRRAGVPSSWATRAAAARAARRRGSSTTISSRSPSNGSSAGGARVVLQPGGAIKSNEGLWPRLQHRRQRVVDRQRVLHGPVLMAGCSRQVGHDQTERAFDRMARIEALTCAIDDPAGRPRASRVTLQPSGTRRSASTRAVPSPSRSGLVARHTSAGLSSGRARAAATW